MDIRSYGLPTLFATLLHVVVLGALLNHWIGDAEPERRSTPHIQARMIDLEAFGKQVAPPAPAPDRQVTEQKATQEKAAREKVAQEKVAQEKARQEAEAKRQQEIQKKKAAEEVQRQKQLAEQKRKAEAESKRKQAELEAKKKAEALAKRKQEEEARRQAQAKREAQKKAEAEAKAKAEAEVKAKALAEAKARAEAEAAARAEAEQAQLAAQQRAESVVGDMQGYIQALIQRNWLVPKTARNGMEAVVAIRLLGNGEVDQASIYKSSGNAAFDQSALQAVYRTERFERVAEVDPILFERRLRSIHIVFRPEGLRW